MVAYCIATAKPKKRDEQRPDSAEPAMEKTITTGYAAVAAIPRQGLCAGCGGVSGGGKVGGGIGEADGGEGGGGEGGIGIIIGGSLSSCLILTQLLF